MRPTKQIAPVAQSKIVLRFASPQASNVLYYPKSLGAFVYKKAQRHLGVTLAEFQPGAVGLVTSRYFHLLIRRPRCIARLMNESSVLDASWRSVAVGPAKNLTPIFKNSPTKEFHQIFIWSLEDKFVSLSLKFHLCINIAGTLQLNLTNDNAPSTEIHNSNVKGYATAYYLGVFLGNDSKLYEIFPQREGRLPFQVIALAEQDKNRCACCHRSSPAAERADPLSCALGTGFAAGKADSAVAQHRNGRRSHNEHKGDSRQKRQSGIHPPPYVAENVHQAPLDCAPDTNPRAAVGTSSIHAELDRSLRVLA